MDDIVLFKPLSANDMTFIVDKLVDQLNRRLLEQHMSVTVAQPVKEWIAEEAYAPEFGARPLKRFVQRHIETPVARLLLQNNLAEGAHIDITMKDGQLDLEIKK